MRVFTLVNAVLSTFWLLKPLSKSNATNITDSSNTTLSDERRICPLAPAVRVNFTLSEPEMKLIYEASKLCLLVFPDFSGFVTQQKIEDYRKIYERFDVWRDWNDQTVVAKTADGTCHAAFAGSSLWNPFDQWQNLNPFPKRLGSDSCWVRRGYFNAYNTSYKDEFRVALDSCMASCGNGTLCNLVLSGYSQGTTAKPVYQPAKITMNHTSRTNS
jgi:hypothetical protein